MNEQIKKLAEQAGFYFYDMHNVNGEDLGETIEADSWTAAEKFAKLIVRECEQRLRKEGELAKIQASTGSEYKFAYMNQAANIVKQHFGVEE